MSGPARAGILVYASDVCRLADFYVAVLGMTPLRRTDELVILGSPDLQLVVHALPADVAPRAVIPAPTTPRVDAAFKFFHTVPSLERAGETVRAHGGALLPGQWHGPGFVVRNAVDPEGNVFHLRAPSP
jgi:predicted enzyme related to lactoylglutathione lyase